MRSEIKVTGRFLIPPNADIVADDWPLHITPEIIKLAMSRLEKRGKHGYHIVHLVPPASAEPAPPSH
jgi:hypothetical protein